MKKSNKLIKGLETIAIIILIISFITLVYCVYISIRAEQSYGSNYQASRTAENIIKEEVGLDVLSDNGITDMGSHI